MSETKTQKWTPGPWECPDKTGVHVRAVDGPYVADCNASAAIHWERKIANSRLIAAAPAMAEALEKLLTNYVKLVLCGDCGFWNPEEEQQVIDARAALALARGETK